MLEFDSPADLAAFMKEDYDKMMNKFSDSAHSIHQQIIKHLFGFRDNLIMH